MNTDNIATVFFPCFMKNPSNDLQEIMKHMDQEKMWVKKLLTGLDVSPYPTLTECIAASAPAQMPGAPPPAGSAKPSEETTATQRAKALPAKPHQQPLPPTPPAKSSDAESKPKEAPAQPTETKPEEPTKTEPAKTEEPEKPAESVKTEEPAKTEEPEKPAEESQKDKPAEKPVETVEPPVEKKPTSEEAKAEDTTESKEKAEEPSVPPEPTEPAPSPPEEKRITITKPRIVQAVVLQPTPMAESAAAAAAASGESISFDVFDFNSTNVFDSSGAMLSALEDQ